MKAFQRIATLILALAMLFSFSSCLAELNLGSSDQDETKETAAQTMAIEGIEKNLKKLQNNADLSYQKMADSERAFEEQRLNAQYGTGLDNSIKKAYSVEQNDAFLKVYEFKKTSDAKTLEGLLKESIQNGVYVQNLKVVRKNNVILFGDADLLDLITSGKSSGSKETTETKQPESTETQPPQTTAPGTELPEDPRDEVDKNGYLKDSLPEDLYFNQTVRIAVNQTQAQQVYAVEPNEDLIRNSLYIRNITVEERLGIEIQWVEITDTSSPSQSVQHIQSTIDSGMPYDAMVLHNLVPSVLATRGLLENICDTPYVDLTAPWWPEDFMNEITVNNQLYSLVESSAPGTLKNLHGVFFNNELIEKFKLQSPYDMVANNTWTFANMMALVKDAYVDLNNDAIKDSNDLFGVMTGTQTTLESWFYGMGYQYSSKNAEGQPTLLINDTTRQPAIANLINTFNTAAATNDFYLYDEAYPQAFFENRAILYMSSIRLVEIGVSQFMDMNYGIVPLPQNDADQAKYVTNVANGHDAWCIPIMASNLEMSSAILECMASESYRQVAPVYFDQCIKLRYAPDERLSEMYDLIRDSMVFDFYSIHRGIFNDPTSVLLRCVTRPELSDWRVQQAAHKGAWEIQFNELISLYQY